MSTHRYSALSLFLLLPGIVSISASKLPAQESKQRQALDEKIVGQLDKLFSFANVESGAAVLLRQEIWRACAIRHGEAHPLLDDLKARLAKEPTRDVLLRIIRVNAQYLRQLGDLTLARRMLGRIEEDEESVADTLAKAEVFDALGSDKQALAGYERLLKREIDPRLKNKILLRKALMASTADKNDEAAKKEKKRSALAVFAAQPGQEGELRNRAAIVLALTNEQKEAISLFKVQGEGTARFRQEVRVAEWALEAKSWGKAQDAAWNAVRAAKLKRDRRYALTILVEAYRRDGKVDELIERFAAATSLDAESRHAWIDMLRETGKVEEALRLFNETGNGRFTTDMRRELLEICRQTDQDETLTKAYLQLIEEEPRFLEWREGLARFYLERGKRELARAVWLPYLQVTKDRRYRMAAAATLMGLGLDELAERFARSCMDLDLDLERSQSSKEAALLFLFELHKNRGRHTEARKALMELDKVAEPGSAARKEMADAYARLGDKKAAVRVLEALCLAGGEEATNDTRMQLALKLSEVGEEEKALTHWLAVWRKVNSIPRRRYVEERIMTVASRLGRLAKVAIDLEQKLVRGEADDREAGLLVRLYIKVNDPVSATEIIEEHMKRSGKKPVDVLTEKARVFQSCEDYYNYEKVVEELVKIDPEGRSDYLRQLALSYMERGKRKEARNILEQLKHTESDSISDEFEAGVLALAGMREEALKSYRRGIARHPERIDTYLLLSNIQKELSRHARSAGMFQYLAATAQMDDLFTIAVDGILNMRDGRSNQGAPDSLVEWTRRVVLERVARRPNKLYLYRLVADLSEEIGDKGMAIRALKAALPIAGEQRTQLLRELMTMSKPPRRLNRGIRIGAGGIIMPRGGKRKLEANVNAEHLMFGRRILGQADIVPPDVYLALGEAFLNAGEVANAVKTFNQASKLPEFARMQRRFAQAFEAAGYPKEALRVYEQILSVENTDLGLLTKVGELHEQTGRDDVARELYERGLALVLNRSIFARTVVQKRKEKKPVNPNLYMPRNRNTDEYSRHYSWLLSGLLASMEEERALVFLGAQGTAITADIARVVTQRKAELLSADASLADLPRLFRRVKLFRRVAVAFGKIALVDAVDRRLLAVFVKDETLLEEQVRFRLQWGYVTSARQLIKDSGRPEIERKKLRLLSGAKGSLAEPGRISVSEAAGLLLPLIAEGKEDSAKMVLERLDLSTGDKSALEQMALLVGSTIYLAEPDLTLTLCRHWLNLAVKHSPGLIYQVVETVLMRARMALGSDELRSLTEHLLTQVVENPDKFRVFLRRLPELRKTVGADFLDRKQIEKLIMSRLDASDRYIYGLEDLFVLLERRDRSSVLRTVWNKLPKTRAAYFLLRLISVLDEGFDKNFSEFFLAAFEKALTDSDDKRILGYQVRMLGQGASTNLELRLKMTEAMEAAGEKGAAILSGKAQLLIKLGRVDEAIPVVQEIFELALPEHGTRPKDIMASSAYHDILNNLREKHATRLVKVFDAIEKKRGSSLRLTKHRLSLLQRLGLTKDLISTLREAIEKHPKDLNLRDQLANALRRRGYRDKALVVQSEAYDLKPDDEARRERLVARWRSNRHPINALALRNEGAKKKKKAKKAETSADAALRKKPQEPATIVLVKKSFDKGDMPLAQRTYRRLWRRYSQLAANNPYMRFFAPNSYRMFWPKDKKAGESTKKEKKRSRGGLPEIFTRALKPQEKRRLRRFRGYPFGYSPGQSQTDGKQEVVTVADMLSMHDGGLAEIKRQLRSFGPEQLGSIGARDLYKALAKIEIETQGQKKMLAQLLEAEKTGRAGKIEYGIALAVLDDVDKAALRELQQSFAGLMKNLNPKDSAQVRRLARLYAKSGRADEASILYRWAALLSGGQNRGFFYSGANELLGEVLDYLEGEARIAAVESILAYSDPGRYGREQYLQLVLETWSDLLGPKAALEKSRKVMKDVTNLDMYPMRSACKMAATLYAKNGEVEEALHCLELALCKLEAPNNTRYPYYRRNFENPGYLSSVDLAILFPKDMKGYARPDEWLLSARARFLEWSEKKRLREGLPMQLLSVLALRFYERGNKELAVESLRRVQELAGHGHAGQEANDLLWVSDVARAIGLTEEAAAIERRLFDEGRLHTERIADVIAMVASSDGPKTALAMGEKAASFTLHPMLLDELISAAQASGATTRAQHWRKIKDEMSSALKTLEAQDKKRLEEAERAKGD